MRACGRARACVCVFVRHRILPPVGGAVAGGGGECGSLALSPPGKGLHHCRRPLRGRAPAAHAYGHHGRLSLRGLLPWLGKRGGCWGMGGRDGGMWLWFCDLPPGPR